MIALLGLAAVLPGMIGVLAAEGRHAPTWVLLAIAAFQMAAIVAAGVMIGKDRKLN